MPFKLNPLIRDRRKLDYYELVPNPLLFKGKIDVNSDFPTLAEVQTGWFYTIGTDVTDNDATKTNTGLSFVAGDEIAWDGTTWITLGNLDLYDARYLRVNGSNSDDTTGDFDFFKNVAYADDEAGNKIKLYRNVATERDSSLSIYCETDEDWQIHSDWDLDITADALMDITADSLSIDATIGYFKIVPSASVDVSLFSDTDVDNDADGKTFSIWRKAAEGDTEIQIYADAIEASHITTNANFHIHPTVDNLLLYAEGGQVILQPYAQGDVELFNITDVADASDGKSLYIHRKASEGDTYFQIYGGDDAATGVISFSGGAISFLDENLITTGTISVGADTDIYSTLGRAWVGYNGNAPHADAAGFGHLDHRSGTNYGFLQNAAGKTTINAASGEDVEIRVANAEEYTFEGHQLQCHSNSIVGVTNFTLGGTLTDGTASLVGGSLTDVKLGSLTTNGFVKTTGADGTLSVDTSTYLTTGDASTTYVP